jgi:hypothetical protein
MNVKEVSCMFMYLKLTLKLLLLLLSSGNQAVKVMRDPVEEGRLHNLEVTWKVDNPPDVPSVLSAGHSSLLEAAEAELFAVELVM